MSPKIQAQAEAVGAVVNEAEQRGGKESWWQTLPAAPYLLYL